MKGDSKRLFRAVMILVPSYLLINDISDEVTVGTDPPTTDTSSWLVIARRQDRGCAMVGDALFPGPLTDCEKDVRRDVGLDDGD